MNKLQAMQVFVRVVETGGVTRAADSLQMPKATATTLIQQLEALLGVKLLNRTTRRVSVTADGAAYYPRCVAILDEVRETEESLAQRHASPQRPTASRSADADGAIGHRAGVAAVLRALSANRAAARLQRAPRRSDRGGHRLRACGAANSKTRP